MKEAPIDDTIAAIITPPGEGGIAAVRMAGSDATTLMLQHFRPHRGSDDEPLRPFTMRVGHFVDSQGSVLDEVTAVFMPHGQSYTGLDQVEFFTHGGRLVVRQVMAELIKSGARPAQPGEFTKLAFLNGRIDLAKAEAVADVIAANTERSLGSARKQLLGAYSEKVEALCSGLVDALAEIEASVDFPEEEIEPATLKTIAQTVLRAESEVDTLLSSYQGGRILREGFRLVIGGRPNAGKSSLFNVLLGQTRALVMPTAGTTRDYLSEWIELEGIAVNLLDTAGLRATRSRLEQAGQAMTEDIMAGADLVLWMCDLSRRRVWSELAEDVRKIQKAPILVAANKLDLAPEASPESLGKLAVEGCFISCKTGEGIPALKQLVQNRIESILPDMTDGLAVTSERHAANLQRALEHLRTGRELLTQNASPELPALELRSALTALEEITGRVYTDDILERIFSRFCVGK